MYVVVAPGSDAGPTLVDVDASGVETGRVTVPSDDLARTVREREAARPRWVWADTAAAYPPLLATGTRVERCVDLRLCHAILRSSALTAASALAEAPASGWDAPRSRPPLPAAQDGLFDLAPVPAATLDPVAELRAQLDAVGHAGTEANRLNLLLAAESAGALVAAELTAAGIPWRADVHDALLADLLGPRPAPGYRPRLLEERARDVRRLLDAPDLNPDSGPELLKALRHAGLGVSSTRSWELKDIDHPVIGPLLEYKKMSRLLAANGWHWLDTWVAGGRFRPTYVPGGVVTGRWASDGGGALQLPHQVRDAVRADPGWKLVVADAAQLEPRILAAMSGDAAMATAGRATDMYEGIVAAGAVETRTHAKYGMLGAMYGGTQGVSGQVLPQLTRAFPQAIGLVEQAARTGERGDVVSTWLGRTSPRPGATEEDGPRGEWSENTGTPADLARARSWGRFTRNFIVQGTAAEWALSWMAILRQRLYALTLREASTEAAAPAGAPSPATAPDLRTGPHLAFFLHDEVMVHTPAHLADEVAQLLRASAAEAGRLLFGPPGEAGVEFPVTVAIVDSYADAKD